MRKEGDTTGGRRVITKIGRRSFLTALGGAAAALLRSRAAHAQTTVKRIAVMMAQPEDNYSVRQEADALRQGLEELGWTGARNIRIDFHWDVSEPARAQMIAKDVIVAQPDLIVSHATPATSAASQLTKTIPIVFVNAGDPVVLGFVANYAHPAGNVTGFTNFEPAMGGKWPEVLKDVDPQIRRIAILFNPETAPAGGTLYLASFKDAGVALGVEPIEAPVHDAAAIEQAIDAFAREPNVGVAAMADNFTVLNREFIVRSALSHRLPLVAPYRSFPEQGGLISYGINTVDMFHSAASYVDRILKGEKPADLPVQAPTKFEMVINLKTAKALGLTVPPSLLAIADDVIE
jgi:putative tryptophan/tyrosine transport system substrate-binding protein